MSDQLLSVEDLCIDYAWGAVAAVQGVSFTVAEGEILGLVGESGSGKSSIGYAMLGHLGSSGRATGRISFAGNDLIRLGQRDWSTIRGREIGMVYQEPQSALNPAYMIGEQIAEGLRRHLGLSGRDARERTLRWMEEVHLPDPLGLYYRYPHQLSGGQLQRVVIAMTFALEPRLVVMDEPTTGLDVTTQARILELVLRLRETTRVAILYVSHDLGVVADLCEQVMVLHRGRVVERGTASEVLRRPQARYTARLVASIPSLHHRQDFSWSRATVDTDASIAPRLLAPLPAERRAGPTLLEVAGLGKTYRNHSQTTRACHDVTFDIRAGESVSLIGESGSGKSTVAKCLLGLEAPTDGRITLDGVSLPAKVHARDLDLRRRIQIVFQDPDGSLNARKTVGDILRRPLLIHGLAVDNREADRKISELLESVDLPSEFSSRYPHELSGGQKQRVAIARALAPRPDLIVCDEAVSALDVTVQSTIIDLCRRLQTERGVAFLFITHDLAVVRQVAERAIVMLRGQICHSGSVDSLFRDDAAPYVKDLIGSVPGRSLEQTAPTAQSEAASWSAAT